MMAKLKILYTGPWNSTGYGRACMYNLTSLSCIPEIDLYFSPIGTIDPFEVEPWIVPLAELNVVDLNSTTESFALQIVHWHHFDISKYKYPHARRHIAYTVFELLNFKNPYEFNDLVTFDEVWTTHELFSTEITNKIAIRTNELPHLIPSKYRRYLEDLDIQRNNQITDLFGDIVIGKNEKRKGFEFLPNGGAHLPPYSLFCYNSNYIEPFPILFLNKEGFTQSDYVEYKFPTEKAIGFKYTHSNKCSIILWNKLRDRSNFYTLFRNCNFFSSSRAEGWGLPAWEKSMYSFIHDLPDSVHLSTAHPFISSFRLIKDFALVDADDPPFFLKQGQWMKSPTTGYDMRDISSLLLNTDLEQRLKECLQI